LERIGKHSINLENNSSECSALQIDWNTYGIDDFEIRILFCGEEYKNIKIRVQKETEVVNSFLPERVYNKKSGAKTVPQENYRLVCEIHGVRYESITEASRITGERENKIRIKLSNQFQNYKIIEKIRHGYENIIANGTEYSSR
jgi:hypothetical protein